MELLGSKTVQEILTEGEKMPDRYIHKDGDVGPQNASSVQLMDVPVIDLGLLTPSSMIGEKFTNLDQLLAHGVAFRSEFKELVYLDLCMYILACLRLLLVFQVINHGMTSEFLHEVREITKQFFALPVEEKHKYLRQVNDIEGYGNDMIFSEQQTLDWSDRLYLTIHPEDHRKLKFWPESPKSFRGTLNQYTMELQVITKTVLKAMARSLNLEDNCFLEKYGEQVNMHARFNFYPPCPRPDLVLGVKPHADGTIITILLQDEEVEGLQFLKDDQWFRAPIVPEALLINVGDQTEILTNGIFKSPVHKVVTNPDRERISLAVFCIPESDKEIGPFESLVNESRPRLYQTVTNYDGIYFEYYQLGRRPIEAAKL